MTVFVGFVFMSFRGGRCINVMTNTQDLLMLLVIFKIESTVMIIFYTSLYRDEEKEQL